MPTGARKLMDDHVKMIRARRVAEQRQAAIRGARSREPGQMHARAGDPWIPGCAGTRRRGLTTASDSID